MKKISFLSLLVALLLCFSVATSAEVNTGSKLINIDKAKVLNTLGLLPLTGSSYALDKTVTRADGTAMIVRLIGKDKAAKSGKYKAIFKDVTAKHAAFQYISYAYQNGIVKGTSASSFSPEGKLTNAEFVSMLLKVMGFKNVDSKNAFSIAVKSGLFTDKQATALQKKKSFIRDDMVYISYKALRLRSPLTGETLTGYLVKSGVVKKETATRYGLVQGASDLTKILDDIIKDTFK